MANEVYQLRSATLAALSGCRPDRKPVAKRVNIVALLPLVEPAGYKLATDGWHESAKYLKISLDVAQGECWCIAPDRPERPTTSFPIVVLRN